MQGIVAVFIRRRVGTRFHTSRHWIEFDGGLVYVGFPLEAEVISVGKIEMDLRIKGYDRRLVERRQSRTEVGVASLQFCDGNQILPAAKTASLRLSCVWQWARIHPHLVRQNLRRQSQFVDDSYEQTLVVVDVISSFNLGLDDIFRYEHYRIPELEGRQVWCFKVSVRASASACVDLRKTNDLGDIRLSATHGLRRLELHPSASAYIKVCPRVK